jgi:hypothetical protein
VVGIFFLYPSLFFSCFSLKSLLKENKMISYAIENLYALGRDVGKIHFWQVGAIFSPSASSRMIVL